MVDSLSPDALEALAGLRLHVGPVRVHDALLWAAGEIRRLTVEVTELRAALDAYLDSASVCERMVEAVEPVIAAARYEYKGVVSSNRELAERAIVAARAVVSQGGTK